MKITKQKLRKLIVEECQALEEEEKVEELLKLIESEVDLYVLKATIVYDKKMNTTDILNKIRALKGVTRTSPQGEATDAGGNLRRHFIDIKIALESGSIQAYMNTLLKEIAAMPEVIRIRVMNINSAER